MEVATATASAPVSAPVVVPMPKRYRMPESKFGPSTLITFDATVPAGTPFEEILKPEYWAHVAGSGRVIPRNKICAMPEEGHWYAELIVLQVGQNWIKVQPLPGYPVALGEDASVEPDSNEFPGYEIKWRGPVHKFAAIRLSDGEPVKIGFSTRQAVRLWLTEHMKAMAR